MKIDNLITVLFTPVVPLIKQTKKKKNENEPKKKTKKKQQQKTKEIRKKESVSKPK